LRGTNKKFRTRCNHFIDYSGCCYNLDFIFVFYRST